MTPCHYVLQLSKCGNFIWLQLIFSQKPFSFCIPPFKTPQLVLPYCLLLGGELGEIRSFIQGQATLKIKGLSRKQSHTLEYKVTRDSISNSSNKLAPNHLLDFSIFQYYFTKHLTNILEAIDSLTCLLDLLQDVN